MTCRARVKNDSSHDLRRIWQRVHANMTLDDDLKEAMIAQGYSKELHAAFRRVVEHESWLRPLPEILAPIKKFYEACSETAQAELEKIKTENSKLTPLFLSQDTPVLDEHMREKGRDYISHDAYLRGYRDVITSIDFILADPELKPQ